MSRGEMGVASKWERWDWRGFEAPRPPCELSIVTTMYRSTPYIDEFYRRMTAAAAQITEDFELIFVNDGSPDPSLEKAKTYADDPRVVIVDLSRNYGHHQAFMAGLSHARGARVFFMDVDLEEQPEWIVDFYREMQETQADVVYGVQEKRVGSFGRVVSGHLFYYFFNVISDIAIPFNPCTVRIMSRRYAEALLTLRDRNLFLAGNYAWLGFLQVPKPVHKIPRRSPSNYNLIKIFLLFVNAVTSFSTYPLKAVFFLGLFVSAVSLSLGAYIALDKLLHSDAVLLGWSSLMVSLWFVAGVIMFAQGLIGIYVAKIFDEVKHKPPYIVRQVYHHPIQTKGAP